MLLVGVRLNSSGDSNTGVQTCNSDKASFWELLLGAWAGLEARVELLLTDFELLVGLNNSGLLL